MNSSIDKVFIQRFTLKMKSAKRLSMGSKNCALPSGDRKKLKKPTEENKLKHVKTTYRNSGRSKSVILAQNASFPSNNIECGFEREEENYFQKQLREKIKRMLMKTNSETFGKGIKPKLQGLFRRNSSNSLLLGISLKNIIKKKLAIDFSNFQRNVTINPIQKTKKTQSLSKVMFKAIERNDKKANLLLFFHNWHMLNVMDVLEYHGGKLKDRQLVQLNYRLTLMNNLLSFNMSARLFQLFASVHNFLPSSPKRKPKKITALVQFFCAKKNKKPLFLDNNFGRTPFPGFCLRQLRISQLKRFTYIFGDRIVDSYKTGFDSIMKYSEMHKNYVNIKVLNEHVITLLSQINRS